MLIPSKSQILILQAKFCQYLTLRVRAKILNWKGVRYPVYPLTSYAVASRFQPALASSSYSLPYGLEAASESVTKW